jgi:hypothetical protein
MCINYIHFHIEEKVVPGADGLTWARVAVCARGKKVAIFADGECEEKKE